MCDGYLSASPVAWSLASWHNGGVNAITPSNLILTVNLGSRTLNLDLAPHTTVVFGRAPQADIHIDESSVSGLHLELTYTGAVVRVLDKGTSNGTFRMPNEAPFSEAEFSLNAASVLQLRLGKVSVVGFSWKPKDVSAQGGEMTRTAFESSPDSKTVVSVLKASEPLIKESAPAVQAPKPAPGVVSKKNVSAYFKFFLLLVYSAMVLMLAKVIWKPDLAFVEAAKAEMRGPGLGIDILAVSLAGYVSRGWFIALLSLGLAIVFYWFWIRSVKHFKLRVALGLWAIVLSIWPIVYPVVLAARNGVTRAQVEALRESQKIFDSSAFTREEKAEKFTQLLPHLQGSSYFYAKVINLFFERVVDECGGSWTDDWNKKKLCLVLINSVTVEVLTEIKPKLLSEVATRLVIVSSLDSIMRIFPVEGPDSELNTVFLKSMESIGLGAEAARVREILRNSQLTSAKKVESLQSLKDTTESALDRLNTEYAVPDVMRVYAPDMLALGI